MDDPSQQQEYRLWRGSDGKFEVQAVYLGLFQNTKVKLRKRGGGMIAVPLDRLSPEDNAYVLAQTQSFGASQSANEIPKAPPPQASISHTPVHQVQMGTVPRLDTSPMVLMGQNSINSNSSATFTTLTCSSAIVESRTQAATATPVTSEKETIVLLPIDRGAPQRVSPMSPESIRLLPRPSLSSITERLGSQWCGSRCLSGLPSNALVRIVSYLDTRTRIRLLWTARFFHNAVFSPDAWGSVWFLKQDLDRVDSPAITILTDFAVTFQLESAVRSIVLDGSRVNADAVVHVLLHFPQLQLLSIQGCWEVHSFPLGGKLMQIAATQPDAHWQLKQFHIGKLLKRGVPREEKQHLEAKAHVPKSFGQDVDAIQTALTRLARGPVELDCHLCRFCNIGSALTTLTCGACGPIPVQKCLSCAPRCDRCLVRMCGQPTCRDPSIQLQGARCGWCDKIIVLCNQNHPECVAARTPCAHCDGLFHRRCRTSEETFTSNECTRCGKVACPKCELSGCAGGCMGQWCRACVGQAGLGHCKCLVLEHATGGKVRKRNVCQQCQQSCSKCGSTSFCERCIKVHKTQCR